MSDVGDSLTEETKCELLLGFFERSELLRGEASYWRRLEYGDRHKTYAWLDESLNTAIARIAEKNNAALRRRHLQEMRLPPAPQGDEQQGHRRGGGKNKWANAAMAGEGDAQCHLNPAAAGGTGSPSGDPRTGKGKGASGGKGDGKGVYWPLGVTTQSELNLTQRRDDDTNRPCIMHYHKDGCPNIKQNGDTCGAC